MPYYDFECEKCRKQFVAKESFEDHDQHKVPKCPKCGSRKVKQLLSEVHVQTSRKS